MRHQHLVSFITGALERSQTEGRLEVSTSEGADASGRKEARETSTTPPVEVDGTAQATGRRRPKEPVGLGGWLILPILGLLVTFVFGLVFVFVDVIPALGADTWSRIPTSGRAVFTLEFFVQLVGIAAAVVLLVLVFMRRRVLPKLAVAFYVFVFLAVVADSIATLIVGAKLIPDPELRAEVG